MSMKLVRSVLFGIGTLAAVGSSAFAQQPPAGQGMPAGRGGSRPPAMSITNAGWEDGGVIPARHVGAAAVSPALEFSNVPAAAVSLVLVLHDVDVARNRMLEDSLHWMLWNIPAATRQLPEALPKGALPDGTQQVNTGTDAVYRGMGAPAGPYHHYVFELYAVDQKLDLPATATRADVLKAIDGHVVAKAAYLGRYHQ